MSEDADLRGLLLAAVGGDVEAHRLFLQRIAPRLRTYLRRQLVRRGGDPFEVEDVLQEALIAIHGKRNAYDPAHPVLAWAYAIARYKLIDHLRRVGRSPAARRVPVEAAKDIAAVEDPTSVESAIDLERLLQLLPPGPRGAIRDVKLEGRSVAETARRRGMSESLVKVSIHRGLKRLAQLLGSGGGE